MKQRKALNDQHVAWFRTGCYPAPTCSSSPRLPLAPDDRTLVRVPEYIILRLLQPRSIRSRLESRKARDFCPYAGLSSFWAVHRVYAMEHCRVRLIVTHPPNAAQLNIAVQAFATIDTRHRYEFAFPK